MLNSELFDLTVHNQFYLQQLSASEYLKVVPYLEEIEAYTTKVLLDAGDTIKTAKQYKAIRADIKAKMEELLGEFEAKYNISLDRIAVQQGTNAGLSLELVLEDYTANFPDNEQMIRAGYIRPLMINGGALTLESYIKDWKPDLISKVEGVITNGFFDGVSTSDMIKAVRGSETQKGVIPKAYGDTEKMVRTSIAQISVNARQNTFKANSVVIGYELVAVLDSRTSTICKGYDGEVYLYKDKYNPLPPFHPYCRTTEIPVLEKNSIFKDFDANSKRASFGASGGKSVKGSYSYYEWLRTQPAWFQDDALGKTKGKIFRNAGLSDKEFKEVSVTQMGKVRTIEEMENYNAKIKDYLAK